MENKKKIHPGSGRRNALNYNKGRHADDTSIEELMNLIPNDFFRQRDMLIESFHLIQDHYKCLSYKHLTALSELTNLPLTEIYETASFYAHFDIIEEGEVSPPPVTIRVCDSITCEMNGCQSLEKKMKEEFSPDVRVVRAPCMGRCHQAPIVEVGKKHVPFATTDKVKKILDSKELKPIIPNFIGFEDYKKNGGYKLLEECLSNNKDPMKLIEEMENSGIRGLGGAGFPTGRKWRFVRAEKSPRLMAINGDEGEPGTFKDHHYLSKDPHRFLEGMLIAAWVVEATDVYIYMRDEYPDVIKFLREEIKKIEDANLNIKTRIHFRRGAGAYICGEESSMLESLEGKRGLPRHKPPFPSQVGLFGRPTLIHNVETVFWVREILEKGATWFSSHGLNGRKGLRTYSVSGRVKNPGVKLAPAGITIKELIKDYCDGMLDDHDFKAYLPGGASGGILPASLDSIPLDFDTLQEHGCFIGSAAIVVLSDKDNMKDIAKNLMFFFKDESCGQCTPCRNGTEKALKLMNKESWDIELLKELSTAMMDTSICGLGQAAPNPLLSVIKHFPSEVTN
ncbi:MAG: NADH-ubiquinone oxidoreductase-F iron-sulfur binding region domain-containing protein [Alphaproteobacteria bacterium]|nr:NADH-ubiquinone oxidoreductase-F iron-sulfur binding region domain-containing protein [Alphaproteobacteria bacterium]